MARKDYYAQNLTAVVVDGVACVDFAEGSCVTVESGGDQANMNKGADGARTSLAFDRTGRITIRLKPMSPTNDHFAGIARRQQAQFFPNSSCAVASGSGELHKATGGSLVTIAPTPTGSNAMEQREWVFQFEVLDSDIG